MAGKTLSFYNLTGGLNTVQDLYTINSTPNRTETPEMYNIEYYKLGGIQSMRGNIQVGSTLDGVITCGFEYILGNNIYHIVTTSNDSVYELDNNTQEFNKIYELSEGTARRHSICHYNNGVIITNGNDFLYYQKDKILSGTISTTEGSAIVTGTDTKFTTEVKVGNKLILRGTIDSSILGEYKVVSIQSDTQLTVQGTIHNTIITGYAYTDYFHKFNPTAKDTQNTSIEERLIKGLAINSYEGRLWIGSYDGNLYYSALGLYDDFDLKSDAGFYGNFQEDNSDFTALGIWSEYLIAHKRQGTYIVDGTNDDATTWTIKPYSESTCESQQSYVSNDIGYFIYSKLNQSILPLLSRSLYNTTYQGKEISTKIKDSFQYLDNTKYNEIYIAYHPLKQYLMFYMNFINGNGYSNKCFIYDIQTKSWLVRVLPQNVTAAYEIDNEIYIGTEEGKVLREFYGSTFDGVPIEFSWLSPSFIWGGGTNKTTTREFRVKLLNTSSNHFNIQSIRDGYIKTKKDRTIKNNQDNGTSLFWDIGYDERDFALGPEETTIYEFQGTDDKLYYSRTKTIDSTTFNVPMYYDKELKNFAGLNQSIYSTTLSTVDDYDIVKYVSTSVYGWVEKDLSYKCYRNGNLRAWIQNNNTKALVNIKSEIYTKWYGVQVGQHRFRVSEKIYNEMQKDKDKVTRRWTLFNYPNDMLYYYNNNWIKTQFYVNNVLTSIGIYTMIKYGKFYDDGLNIERFWNPNGTGWSVLTREEYNAYKFQNIPLSGDTVKSTREVWNGRSDSQGAMSKPFTKSGDNIIININGQNLTFTRYDIGDFGTNLADPVYTKNPNPNIGDDIYSEDESIYSTVKNRGTGTITAANNKVLNRESSADTTIRTLEYYKLTQVLFTYVQDINTTISPDYPTEGLNLSLTDTIWDWTEGVVENNPPQLEGQVGDLWTKEGYETKRFLLPDQYFETIQYRFYGTTEDDSLAIAGFEIDGIQLTEVPW